MKRTNERNRVASRQAVLFIFTVLPLVLGSLGPVSARDSGPVVKCRVETDRSVLTMGKPRTVVVKVTLDADKAPERTRRPPVNLAIVLDRSGSMQGEKLERAKEAAIEALERLGASDFFSLVCYDHNVRTVVPVQRVKDAYEIRAKIMNIGAGGRTALFGGVSRGASEVRRHLGEELVNRIILLSDGLANVGPSSAEELGRLGAALIKEGISVTTVGVGLDYNEDLMTRLSGKSDGNSYFVESSKDLPGIFSAELGDVLSVVAKKVRVDVEFPENVKPLGIIGREGRIRDGKVELFMNQLYGGQEKYALIEIQVPAGKLTDRQDVATAKVAYFDLLSQREANSRGIARIVFTKDKADEERSVNVAVQKAYEIAQNAVVQENAVALADKGRHKEAVEVLKKSSERLKQAGRKYKSDDLLNRGEQTAVQAAQVSSEGMTKRNRKKLKTDSYQAIKQQKNR